MIYFRPMDICDGEFVLKIRNHESTRNQLENNSEFTLENFRAWFKKTSPKWLIIYDDQIELQVGYARLNYSKNSLSVEIGMDIHPEYRGLGIGYDSYLSLLDLFKEWNTFTLKVFKDNIVAYNLYKKLGFKDIPGTEVIIRGRPYVDMVLYKDGI